MYVPVLFVFTVFEIMHNRGCVGVCVGDRLKEK